MGIIGHQANQLCVDFFDFNKNVCGMTKSNMYFLFLYLQRFSFSSANQSVYSFFPIESGFIQIDMVFYLVFKVKVCSYSSLRMIIIICVNCMSVF